MAPPPLPKVTLNGYEILCPICNILLVIDNRNASNSRLDAQIHLLAHIAWLSEEQVFPGEARTPTL